MGKKDRQRKQKNKQQKQQKPATGGGGAKGNAKATKAVKPVVKAVKPEQPPLVLGFQVGNTNSRISYQGAGDEHPDLIAAECGSRLIKSCVAFEADGRRVVGSAAYNIAIKNPAGTVTGVKGLIAAGGAKAMAAFQSADGAAQEKPATEVLGTVLAYLKGIGETVVDRRCDYAVFAVSDFAPQAELDVVEQAAKAPPAALKQVFFLRESTAACLAYGCDTTRARSYSQLFAVANVGGTSSSVTVVETLNGLMRPVYSTGPLAFGGKTILDTVYNHFFKLACRKMPKLQEASTPAKALRKLREAVIFAVHSLTKSAAAHVNVEALCDGQDFRAPISQGLFHMLIGTGITQVFGAATQQLFAAPGLKGKAVTGVIVSGGGASAPYVQRRLGELVADASGSKPKVLQSIEPAEVCAMGAAVQAKLVEETLVKSHPDAAKIAAFSAEIAKAEQASRAFPGGLAVAGHEVAAAGAVLPLTAELEVDAGSVAIAFNGADVAALELPAAGKHRVVVTVDVSGSATVEAFDAAGESPVARVVVQPANADNNFAGGPEPEPEVPTAVAENGDGAAAPAVPDAADEEESADDDDSEDDSDDESGDGPAFVPVMDMDDDMD